MPKRFLLAANWKMNPAPAGFDAPDSPYRPRKDMDIVVFPSFIDIEKCVKAGLVTGGQWGHPKDAGASTGDVSMAMLKADGCTYVLCGHSERRKNHGETDAFVAEQAKAALAAGLIPIVCVGETDVERTKGKEKEVVETQLAQLPKEISIIAYEPVWAIGTGKNATPKQAQEMHAFIRTLRPTARIIYGGSLTEQNAKELFAQPDVEGGLVGGASLKPSSFAALTQAAAV
jgi:triosephosphate isomerase